MQPIYIKQVHNEFSKLVDRARHDCNIVALLSAYCCTYTTFTKQQKAAWPAVKKLLQHIAYTQKLGTLDCMAINKAFYRQLQSAYYSARQNLSHIAVLHKDLRILLEIHMMTITGENQPYGPAMHLLGSTVKITNIPFACSGKAEYWFPCGSIINCDADGQITHCLPDLKCGHHVQYEPHRVCPIISLEELWRTMPQKMHGIEFWNSLRHV